ncbi:MAG: hypothetical protein M3Q58_07335 [Bacteroidota bacterium]|nr:hypothetical protein [Bacteroidota bacterium]
MKLKLLLFSTVVAMALFSCTKENLTGEKQVLEKEITGQKSITEEEGLYITSKSDNATFVY